MYLADPIEIRRECSWVYVWIPFVGWLVCFSAVGLFEGGGYENE